MLVDTGANSAIARGLLHNSKDVSFDLPAMPRAYAIRETASAHDKALLGALTIVELFATNLTASFKRPVRRFVMVSNMLGFLVPMLNSKGRLAPSAIARCRGEGREG